MEVQVIKEEQPQQAIPQLNIGKEIVEAERSLRRILSSMAMLGRRDFETEPTVDIFEDGDKVTILFDLPGLRKEQIKLRVGINYVEVVAEPAQYIATGKPILLERFSNYRLRRRIEFPFNIRLDDVKAFYKDGVLQVNLSKAAGSGIAEVPIE